MRNTLSRVNLRTWYLTCHISWHGILDNKKCGGLVWIDGGTKPKHSPVFPKIKITHGRCTHVAGIIAPGGKFFMFLSVSNFAYEPCNFAYELCI